MKKLKLELEDLAVESFDTTPGGTHGKGGTVLGQNHCTCPTDCTCPGCPTCGDTCGETCGDSCGSGCYTCPGRETCEGGYTCGYGPTCDLSCDGICGTHFCA